MNKAAIKRAVKLAGGQVALAKRVAEITGKPVRQPYVWNWLNRDAELSPEWVIPIETATDGRVTRHQLRPDIYPANDSA